MEDRVEVDFCGVVDFGNFLMFCFVCFEVGFGSSVFDEFYFLVLVRVGVVLGMWVFFGVNS